MLEINNKNLFVHYPKTGGTFVREILGNYANTKNIGDHKSHSPLTSVNVNVYDYVFATVRNPFDWYGSVWKFLKNFGRNKPIEENNPLAPLWKLYNPNFNGFISNVLEEKPGFYSNTFFEYIGDQKVDRFLKTETLSFDLVTACREMGIGKNANAIIAAPHFGQRDIPYIWDKGLKNQVFKKEFQIIEQFYL